MMDHPGRKFNTIDEYINAFPENVRSMLSEIRQTVRASAPEAEETIKYDMPTFILYGNLVYFSAFKNHIGFYPAPVGNEGLMQELKPYLGAKSSLRFRIGEPLPLPLIRKVVKHRMKENLARSRVKKK